MAGLSIKSVEHGIKHLGGELSKDAKDVISHPQLLAGAILGGPVGVAALAELHRGGHLTSLLKQAGLGALTKGGGGHPTPGSNTIDTTTGSQGFCWPGGLKPFPLVGSFTLAAGAQTQGTTLGDFHAAANNPTVILANDLIPGNVEVFSAQLGIGVKMLTTAGAETMAKLLDVWMIEAINGTEIARWSMPDLHAVVDHSGLLTSGSVSSQFIFSGAEQWIPWHRKYDPNTPYALNVQIGVTYTTIQAIDFTFAEAGRRP